MRISRKDFVESDERCTFVAELLKNLYNMATVPSSYDAPVQNVSSVDALWALIQSQTRSVRQALTERLFASDAAMAEKIVLKNSIEQGWAQVKKMAQNPEEGLTLEEFLNELKS